MHLISGSTVSNVVLQAFNTILSEGHYRPSRNGGCTSIFDVTFEVDNPRSRHLYLKGRKSNIFALIAETFWVFAGENEVDPYLSFFLPRAPQYSDDEVTWHGAYGPRIYEYNQHVDAFNNFVTDGLTTRRSFIQISMPDQDNQAAIELMYGDGHKAKDIPCNREIHFYVEGEDQFCTKVIQRSGDIIFGTGSINPFEFSFLHEMMYNEVKREYPDLKLGPYRWHVTNCHLYDFSREQAEAATQFTENYGFSLDENDMPLLTPTIGNWENFFGELVQVYTEAITGTAREVGNLISNLGHVFVEYELPLESNLLWTYTQLVAHYIASKKGVTLTMPMDLMCAPTEIVRAVNESTFRKFDVLV